MLHTLLWYLTGSFTVPKYLIVTPGWSPVHLFGAQTPSAVHRYAVTISGSLFAFLSGLALNIRDSARQILLFAVAGCVGSSTDEIKTVVLSSHVYVMVGR